MADASLTPMAPLFTAEQFPPLYAELVGLLRSLGPDDWDRPTLAPRWSVRDVAAHMLDIDLRGLSFPRDDHFVPDDGPIETYADLVALINRLNEMGVRYLRRLSPRLMIDLFELTGPRVAEQVASQPPHGQARHSVAWAGEQTSENWMNIGREYTERWHHQMQIREAVGAPRLLERRWLHPVLDLSVRALPRAYADTAAPTGTTLVLEVAGEGGGAWSLVREEADWRVWRGAAADAATRVRLEPDAAWKMFFNALGAERAAADAAVTGDERLAKPLFRARAVMV
ncbi:MAG TPA: maleylpyruvate isomerase family mycothiol-dependent enzyme [Longimicrobium sp.]|nr:maleylpyruvate isomerase family mycothiol-dependent enzyme [Longimicrobium sp.]